MASLVSRQPKSLEKTSTLLKFSVNFIRSFASSAPTPSSDGSVDADKPKKRSRKMKNLFDVAQFLPNWGIGYHMARTKWRSNHSYLITGLNLYKGGRHGKAWGIAHKDGVPIEDAAKRMSGVNKRGWKFIPHVKVKKAARRFPSSPVIETPPQSPVPEPQPA